VSFETETASGRCAAQLARGLLARGLLDQPWAEAFTQIRRDLFLPTFYHRSGDSWQLITPETVGTARWLQLAYQDVTWVQRLNGPGGTPGAPASSCIQPSLAARMLTALTAGPGDRVLEIGAGTGWLTALLSHRCGADNITAVELDPELVDQARTTLNQLGHHATLSCADGFTGVPDHAPYDRLLSTAAVSHIPRPWLTQTRPGGRIVAPLRQAVAILDVGDQDQATGRFLPEPVQILPLRSTHDHSADDPRTEPPPHPTTASAIALRDQRFRFFLGLRHPTLNGYDHGLLADIPVTGGHDTPAHEPPSGKAHVHGGPDTWTTISHTHEQWEHAGRPGPDNFLITVDKTGQWVRLTEPTPEQQWRIG
jgi:protein-L-isoaspartate(D-aspartate) O-methyltransferase